MRKKVFSLVALLVVLILLAVGTFLALKIKTPDGTSSSSDLPVIKALTLQQDKISQIKVKTDTEDYLLKRKDKDTFIFADKANNILDKTSVDGILSNLSDLSATTLATSNASNLADYGLDKPTATLNITLEDGKTVDVFIGSKSPKGDYYLKSSLTSDVYAVSSYVVEGLTVKKLSLYDKSLQSGVTAENLTAFELKRTVGDTISITKSAEQLTSDQAAAGGSALELSAPIKSEIDTDKFGTGVVASLTAMAVSEIFSDDYSAANLKKYGLDKPSYTLSYTFDSKTETIYIGTLSTQGEYYCTVKGKELIVKILKSSLPFLEYTVSDFAMKLQYLTNIKDVNNIKIEGLGKSYSFQLIGSEGDTMQVKYNDKELSADDFRTLYQTIIGVGQNAYVTAKPNASAEVTITFSLKDGKTDVLAYIPYDFRNYFFALNGTGKFIVSKDSVAKILTNAEKYINGQKFTA